MAVYVGIVHGGDGLCGDSRPLPALSGAEGAVRRAKPGRGCAERTLLSVAFDLDFDSYQGTTSVLEPALSERKRPKGAGKLLRMHPRFSA